MLCWNVRWRSLTADNLLSFWTSHFFRGVNSVVNHCRNNNNRTEHNNQLFGPPIAPMNINIGLTFPTIPLRRAESSTTTQRWHRRRKFTNAPPTSGGRRPKRQQQVDCLNGDRSCRPTAGSRPGTSNSCHNERRRNGRRSWARRRHRTLP